MIESEPCTELETIRFKRDTLYVTRFNHGINYGHHDYSWGHHDPRCTAYVSINSIIDALGLDRKAQRNRINRDPVLSSTRVIMTSVAADKKQREMVMLPIEYLNGWLFGIDPNRVKPELKDKIIAYQRECYFVLADHFRSRERFTHQQCEGTVRQLEAYLFGKYPHWRIIRDYYLLAFPFKRIAAEAGKSISACRRAVNRMIAFGLINPRDAALRRNPGQFDVWLDLNPGLGW